MDIDQFLPGDVFQAKANWDYLGIHIGDLFTIIQCRSDFYGGIKTYNFEILHDGSVKKIICYKEEFTKIT